MKVLVIAVHPDDETLGCGGALLRHRAQGGELHWMIATELVEKDGFETDLIQKRNEEIKKVSQCYGFEKVHRLGLATMKVDQYGMSELITKVSEVMKAVQPAVLYLPFKSDVHSDHRRIFEAVYSCTKVFRYPVLKKIYMMEVLSETEFAPSLKEDSFIPNYFVDISKFLEKKIEIMKIFQSEMGEHPFPRNERNIRALATYRGATAGVEYAESFMLLKEIQA